MTWCELFAGSAPTALRALSARLAPFTPYYGSKRRLAPLILATAGVRAGSRPRVVLSDAGPWGGAWSRLARDPRRAERAADYLDAWAGEDPLALFARLASAPPDRDPDRALAGWLWLQARAANNLPVWWDDARGWRMGDRPRSGARLGEQALGGAGRGHGCARPSTVAQRLRAFAREAAGAEFSARRATAHRARPDGDLTGWTVFLDAPYRGFKCYSHGCTRSRLVELARDLVARHARVLVAEHAPVAELDGWPSVRLAPGEWLTCSFAPLWRPPEQLALTPEFAALPEDADRPRRPRPSRPPPAPPALAADQLPLFPGASPCPSS